MVFSSHWGVEERGAVDKTLKQMCADVWLTANVTP